MKSFNRQKPSRMINLIYMALLFVIFVASGIIHLTNEHEDDIKRYKKHSLQMQELLTNIIRTELFNNNYRAVAHTLDEWFEQNDTTYEIKATSANGFILSHHKRTSSSNDLFQRSHTIEYGYNGQLNLYITDSLDNVFDNSRHSAVYVFIIAIVLALISGQFLWIIEQKRYNLALENLTYTDPLTKIFNRRYLDETLQQEFYRAQRTKQPLSLIMIDIDKFKAYNDNFGHQAGDECLSRVATALNNTLKRPGEFVARYGGEEFTVVLPNVDTTNAIKMAELLKDAINKLAIPSQMGQSTDPTLSASLGTATCNHKQEQNLEELINNADLALYRAKNAGGNCVITI